jgi:hypothetical protein
MTCRAGDSSIAKEVYDCLGISERITIVTTDEGHRATSPRIAPAWQGFFEKWLKTGLIEFTGYQAD